MAKCFEVVRKGGTLVPLGVQSGPIHTDFNKIMMKELNVIGSYGYVWTSWQRTVQLLGDRKIDAGAIISHELPLEEFREGFQATQDGSAIKVVLNPLLRANGKPGH